MFKQVDILSHYKPSDVGDSYLQEYLEKRLTLMKELPRGYSVAQLMFIKDPMQLAALDGVESHEFAMMDRPGLWLERNSEAMMA